MWESFFPYVAGLLPTIGISFLVYHVFKNIVEADRRERIAQAQWEASRESASKRAAEPEPGRQHPTDAEPGEEPPGTARPGSA